MAYTTIFDNVLFIEGEHTAARKVTEAKIRKGGIGAQMKNLDNIKAALAQKAKAAGCNCVVEFKYGQKSRLFAIDDVAFYGSGVLAELPDNEYQEAKSKIKQ